MLRFSNSDYGSATIVLILLTALIATQLGFVYRALRVMVTGIRAMRADLQRLIDVQGQAPR